MRSRPARGTDELLARQTSRQLAARTAALVAVAMLVLVTLVTLVVVRGQARAATALLRTTALSADDVADPPAGTWLALTGSRGTTASPGLPRDLTAVLEHLRARASGQVSIRQVRSADADAYRVATLARGSGTVQVVQDLTAERSQRGLLLRVMAAAAAVALVLSLGLGLLLGRRAVRPFTQALTLQRAFVADASHELRTPLTLLSTRAQLLDAAVQGSGLPVQVRQDSTSMLDDVRRLGAVLEDLLVAADPGGRQLLVTVDVDSLARGCVASASDHAQAAGVDLVFCGSDAAQASRPEVRAAAAGLRRAVLALVDNAVDHTPRGGRVTVSCRREGTSIVLAVSDTGPGVDPAAAPLLFRRFHSGGQRSGRAHYGLGLALTQEIAHRHGGQLRLTGVGAGATFELVLPARGSELPGN